VTPSATQFSVPKGRGRSYQRGEEAGQSAKRNVAVVVVVAHIVDDNQASVTSDPAATLSHGLTD